MIPVWRALPVRRRAPERPTMQNEPAPARRRAARKRPAPKPARPAGASVPTASVLTAADQRTRCWWPGSDPLYLAYHDHEWGVPVHDDRTLFEFLVLEGAQAGLSWITILRKREA